MVDESQTQFVHIPDHKARAVAMLLSQFQDKPRIVALVEALAEGVQLQEDDTFSLIVSRTLKASAGALLDQWGTLVGEPRGGFEDIDYRRFIDARMLANRSEGTLDHLIAVLALATGAPVKSDELSPMTIVLRAFTPAPMSSPVRERVRRLMFDIKTGGRALELVEAPAGYFGFRADPSAEGYSRGVWARLI